MLLGSLAFLILMLNSASYTTAEDHGLVLTGLSLAKVRDFAIAMKFSSTGSLSYPIWYIVLEIPLLNMSSRFFLSFLSP